MQHDYFKGLKPGFCDRFGYAAELRAIAKEASLLYEDNDPAASLIAWLRAEADRAEAGQ